MQVAVSRQDAGASNPTSERLGEMAIAIEPVDPEARCGQVYERFRRDLDLIAIPVVHDRRPVGLVNRHELAMSLAQDYGRALYALKPITVRMDRHPLIVEGSVEVDALERVIAMEKPTALMRGFIVTRNGEYAGVGTALSVLQMSLLRTERRNRELEETRLAAERANRMKSRFLANVSHELRTPLNAIIGFSDLMRSEHFGALSPAKSREYANDIHTSSQNLLAVINDILDMAKVEEGKMTLFEESVDLAAQAGLALRFVEERARQGGVTLRRELEPNLPLLLADQRSVRHILINLLSNAVKFTPPGGYVTVTTRLDRGHLELTVADTGIGMSPAHVEIALTPFGQVANEYTRKHDGTGLGLSLVKSLAELHGATLEIESSLGAGTRIRVRFAPERVLASSHSQAS